MKKLKLNLDELLVESFETTKNPYFRPGTVFGFKTVPPSEEENCEEPEDPTDGDPSCWNNPCYTENFTNSPCACD